MARLSAKDYGKILYHISHKYKGNTIDIAIKCFINILQKNRALHWIEKIISFYENELDKKELKNSLKITLAHDSEVSDLINKMELEMGKFSKISKTVDTKIIGGVILKHGNTIYDGSVATSIRMLKESIT